MTTSFFNSRTWLSLALFLGLLVALPTGAFAQISADAQQRVAAALPQGVTPDDATAEQLAAAVAKALRADGMTAALAGEIVQYALGLPAIQGAGPDAIVGLALQIMNAALDAAPAEAAYVDSITMATVFVVPSSAVEVNAERVRRGQPALSNPAVNATLAQPFLGNPPTERGQRKVTICHRGRTIEVAEPAVAAHLAHGDTLGACEVTPSKNK